MFTIAFVFMAVFVAIPVLILLIETLAATVIPSRHNAIDDRGVARRDRIAVLVPAHNESTGLLPTLTDIQKQLRPSDRLLVVADNCTDDTAIIASSCGAEVAERNDLSRQGKGYALHFGLQRLSEDPPAIVIMLDADSRLEVNALNELALKCAATGRPVQSLYLMTTPHETKVNYQVAEFAWRVKNWLRPTGLLALGLPCQLMGAGMAFPWPLISGVDLASGWIVEDLKLGVDLAAMGHPALFCPSARVTSQFASTKTGSATQRQRWERGHLTMIFSTVPRLLRSAVTRLDLRLLGLALDLSVPPLALLTMLVLAVCGLAFVYALLGYSLVPLIFSVATALAFSLTICVAWANCGRDVFPFHSFVLIVPYVAQKISIYVSLLFKRADVRWIRTDRTKSE